MNGTPEYNPQTYDRPNLGDLLTVERSVTIFYSYARETQFSKLLNDPSKNITVMAPTNKAVISLPRKPHEGPLGDNVEKMPEISQIDYDAISRSNVEKWVGAHIVAGPLAMENKDESYDTLLPGLSMHLTLDYPSRGDAQWEKYVVNGDITILDMKEASNGVLYLIDGTSLY